jgi:hypothetical protein
MWGLSIVVNKALAPDLPSGKSDKGTSDDSHEGIAKEWRQPEGILPKNQ